AFPARIAPIGVNSVPEKPSLAISSLLNCASAPGWNDSKARVKVSPPRPAEKLKAGFKRSSNIRVSSETVLEGEGNVVAVVVGTGGVVAQPSGVRQFQGSAGQVAEFDTGADRLRIFLEKTADAGRL